MSENTRRTYIELLRYYYLRGIGNVSKITGAIITKSLVSIVEKRFNKLGGHLPTIITCFGGHTTSKKEVK